MKIDCISDLHGFFPKLGGGDLLVIAGDCTKNDSVSSWDDFFYWLDKQEYKNKIMIAGNHDNFCNQWAISGTFTDDEYDQMYPGEKPLFDYLCDSRIELVTDFNRLKIWGSPWTNTFEGINPKCCAFAVDTDQELEEKWKLIPNDTEILITHSPPYGILDGIEIQDGSLFHVGSKSLRNIVLSKERLPNLKLHVFGHIHENGGRTFETNFAKFINASYVNENYKPVNKPISINIG